MFIKSIALHNFRQFKDSTISFETEDVERNVTVVMGDNGSGKTTLAQAFQWGLYGETAFKIRDLLNQQVKESIEVDKPQTISVAIEVNYNGTDYTIKRSQLVRKNSSSRLDKMDSKFTISFVNEEGNSTYLEEGRRDYLLKQMMPKGLSRFFFFDGERIEEMSEEIDSGQSEEFKNAVEGLVGLTATQNAMIHLNPRSKTSVIGKYTKLIEENSKSSKQIEELKEKIERFEKAIEYNEQQKENLNKAIKELTAEQVDLMVIIKSQTPQIEIKKQYQDKLNQIQKLEESRVNKIRRFLLPTLDSGLFSFLSKKVIDEVSPMITEDGQDDKIIPKLSSDTLTYLLNRKKCICGCSLEAGTKEFSEINSLYDYAFPKTIGMQIDEYKRGAKDVNKEYEKFWPQLQDIERELAGIDAQIEGLTQDADELFSRFGNTEEGEKAKKRLKIVKDELSHANDNLIRVESNYADTVKQKNRFETELNNLFGIDSNNEEYIRYKAYATRIYNDYRHEYTMSEENVRRALQNKINEIFAAIYDGNINISVDEKYQIKVSSVDSFQVDEELEKNTAQRYAIIFAFIAAIIALEKEKINSTAVEEEDKIDEEVEGYPLVMDAPLSAFDKTRIQKICEEIPKIANQVVIFIKDTDGEVAEQYMGNKISNKYEIQKVDGSNLHSTIERRG